MITLLRRTASAICPDIIKEWRFRHYCTPQFFTLPKHHYLAYGLPYVLPAVIANVVDAGGFWEPELTTALVEELKSRGGEKPIVVDIGANIGLVSLTLAHSCPGTTIHAFEPSPVQHSVFEKTLEHNHLQGTISLYRQAIGEKDCRLPFAVHYGIEGCGLDGFLDTKLGGPSVKITVKVRPLDTWWLECGKPKISLLKIDTEGSEIGVLRSARLMLVECKPTIAMEIWPDHLACYGFNIQDMLHELQCLDYILMNLAGEMLNSDYKGFGVETNFLARHKSLI
jgi:FkbM family methyltransferase